MSFQRSFDIRSIFTNVMDSFFTPSKTTTRVRSPSRYQTMIGVILFAMGLMLSFGSHASQKAQVETLKQYVSSLKSLRANFVQIQPEEELFRKNQSSGYMVMKRPGQLLWVYQKPEQQEIVTDGQNLWIYDAEIDQASVRPMSSVQEDFPLRWLLYNESLEKSFDIIPGQVENGVSWFNLVPKEGTFFQSLDVAIADGKMTQIWMYQSPENVTKVRFVDIEQNRSVDGRTFIFKAPSGVDVIGQPQPLPGKMGR